MKQFLLAALLLLTFTGCGAVPETSDSREVRETMETPAVQESRETLESDAAPEEAAGNAYEALLSGDASLLDEYSAALHGVENWTEFIQSEDFTYEYTCMDLDGDGLDELLIQMEDDPSGYNGVFHYADGRLFCWRNDNIEMSCRDYPLRDGTIVRQYDYSDNSTYTICRYQSDGNTQEVTKLHFHNSPLDQDDGRTFPWYGIDYNEVTEGEFNEQLAAKVTGQLLDRSAWTVIHSGPTVSE